MYLQIRLPLACFLIMIYCFGYYRAKKRLPTRTSRTFEWFSYAVVVHLVAATVTEYTVNNRDKVPESVNYLWHIVFLVSITATCFLLLYYLTLYIERGTGRPQRVEKIALAVVCTAGIIAQIFLPIEYIDTPHGSYSLGPKAYSLYVVVIYVLIRMLVKLIKYRKVIGGEKSNVFLASIGIFVAASSIQIFFPYMLLTSPALTLIILGIMVNTEDAHLYVSYKTELYNELGCRELIQEKISNRKPYRLGIYVFVGAEDDIESAMLSLDREFTKKNPKLICGLAAENVLLVMPITNFWGGDAAELPENLPFPEDMANGLKFFSRILEFDTDKSAEQVQGSIRDCKLWFEEEIFQRDGLTGLLRREAFIRQAEHLVSQKEAFCLLMIDLDDFKSINDTFGHRVGDDVLRYVADTFRAVVRKSDTVCRMGGDEFAIILHGLVDMQQIRNFTERIKGRLLTSAVVPDKKWRISASFGAKIYTPEDGSPSFQELYAEADAALYRTKYNGKNDICFAEQKVL